MKKRKEFHSCEQNNLMLKRKRTFYDESALVLDPDSARQGECVKGKNFTIQKQRAALECPTFPVSPREIRAPQECLAAILDCRIFSRNSKDTSGNVFESLPDQAMISPSLPNILNNLADSYCEGMPEIAMRHGEGLRREPQSSTISTPRFSRNLDTWNSMHRTEELIITIV